MLTDPDCDPSAEPPVVVQTRDHNLASSSRTVDAHIVQHLLPGRRHHTLLSIEDLPGIERCCVIAARLVVFEIPTNPVTKIADIEHLTGDARAPGALRCRQHVCGFHNHGRYDIDISARFDEVCVGHGDVMGGAIIARSEVLAGCARTCVDGPHSIRMPLP